MRVAVLGAAGRMGAEVCAAVLAAPDLELVAVVDPLARGRSLEETTPVRGHGLEIAGALDAIGEAGAEVAVDFTVAEVALETMKWCAQNAVHAVVGTTGISRASLSEMEVLFESSSANCVIAANFAIGAVLMMRFAEMAAPFMDGAEIIESHHAGKLDAPSGTALVSAERLDAARRRAGCGPWPPDRTSSSVLAGTRGGETPGGVRIHSVRLPGLVAHQEVVMGTVGQTLTLRHDAYDRTSFLPGVLMAVKAVGELPGLTVGLDSLLGF